MYSRLQRVTLEESLSDDILQQTSVCRTGFKCGRKQAGDRRKLTGVIFDLKRPRKKWEGKEIKDNLAETLELTKS